MPQVTNATLRDQIDEMREDVNALKVRLTALELQLKESMPILQRIEAFFTIFRRTGYLVAGAIFTQGIAWLIFHLLGH